MIRHLNRHSPDSCRIVREFAPFPRFGQSCAVGAGCRWGRNKSAPCRAPPINVNARARPETGNSATNDARLGGCDAFRCDTCAAPFEGDGNDTSVEVIVQADANDMTVEARRTRRGIRENGGPRHGERQPTDTESNPAEIVVEILGFDAPVRREHPFEATTRRPARAGIRETSERGRKAKAKGRDARSNVNALVNPAVSETAAFTCYGSARRNVTMTRSGPG
jgi:hypothetical protein